jgi:membrane protein DedA with SNARE-associated domain
MFNAEHILTWLTQYAYEPHMVYLAVAGILLASAFGLPIPEEVPIVSVGLLSYMGAHPEEFPPPYAGASVVNGYEAALVLLLAVIAADSLVFGLGRLYGRRIVQHPRLRNLFSEKRLGFIDGWVHKYGNYAIFLFRFTPGARFPAHIILGMSAIPYWQFAIVDGFATLISVPTQIVLIYHFGKPIISVIHEFRNGLLIVVAVVATIFLVKTWLWPIWKKRSLG